MRSVVAVSLAITLLPGMLIAPLASVQAQNLFSSTLSSNLFPGGLDASFHLSAITGNTYLDCGNTDVEDLALTPNGEIYIGGHFTSVDGLKRVGLARLTQNGFLDLTFQPSVGVDSHSVFLDSHGRVIGGTGLWRSTRFNADGTVDPTWPMLTVVGQQPDDRVLGIERINSILGLKRYLANGDVDPSFNVAPLPTTDDRRHAILLQPDGKILFFHCSNADDCGSVFSRFNSDGTIDSSFTSFAFSPNFGVMAGAVGSDGKILLAGNFGNGLEFSGSALVRMNPDGSLDKTFNVWTNSAVIGAIALQIDGKIIVGVTGCGTEVFPTGITRLNSDGSNDSTFDFRIAVPETRIVNRIIVQPDGRILISGAFRLRDGTDRSLLRLNGDSLSLSAPNLQPDGRRSLTVSGVQCNKAYTLQFSTDLMIWTSLQTQSTYAATMIFSDLPEQAQSHGFYRILRP